MCCFAQNENTYQTESDREIAEYYYAATNIHVAVSYLDRSSGIGQVCQDYRPELCGNACIGVKNNLENYISNVAFSNSIEIAYIFRCFRIFSMFSVGAFRNDGIMVCFTAGPIRTWKEPTAPIRDIIKQFGSDGGIHIIEAISDPIKDVPYLSPESLHYVSRLLFDLVNFKYASSLSGVAEKEIPPLVQDKTANSNFDIEMRSQSLIQQSNVTMKEYCAKILSYAEKFSFDKANETFMEMLHPFEVRYFNDAKEYIGYVIGCCSYFNQYIVDHPNVQYSQKFNRIYGTLCKTIILLDDTSEVTKATLSFFLDYCDEIYFLKQSKMNTTADILIEYIQSNYNQVLSIKGMASDLNLSMSYMCRVFKNNLGITIKKYITYYRIMMAAKFILETKKSVNHIAEEVGYVDLSLFRRDFKAFYKCTPSEYRLYH